MRRRDARPVARRDRRPGRHLCGCRVPGTGVGEPHRRRDRELRVLSVFAADTTWPGHSNINWYETNAIVANAVTSALSTTGDIKVRCGQGSTHFIVDVMGYYL